MHYVQNPMIYVFKLSPFWEAVNFELSVHKTWDQTSFRTNLIQLTCSDCSCIINYYHVSMNLTLNRVQFSTFDCTKYYLFTTYPIDIFPTLHIDGHEQRPKKTGLVNVLISFLLQIDAMASTSSTLRRDMTLLLILQVAFIIVFFFCTQYDPELSSTLPSANTPALDHYYPRK